MAKITESLSSSIKSAAKGGLSSIKVSSVKDEAPSLLKIIAKNSMSFAGLARDLNVARQNIQRLVKLEGGEPSRGADAQFLKSSEAEKKLEVETTEKKEEDKKPTPVKKGPSAIKKLKDKFTGNKILMSLTKYLAIGAIVGIIFVAFKDTFTEWVKGLWSAISQKFTEFTEEIKQWFSNSVAAIGEKLKAFVQPIIDTVSSFFSKVGDFFVGYFGIWRDVITSPIATIKKVYDAFMGKVNKLVDMLPDWVKEKLGIGKKEAPVDDSAEKKKLERQQKEALETERIKKLEKEKQYTGEDEIVRARLGLPEKTETMRREAEVAKAPPPPVEPAPPPAPIIVPGPPPKPKEAPTPIPKAKEAPKPISAEPPTAVGKAAEGPEKRTEGSFTSFVKLQPGVDLSGIHPEFEKRLTAMAAAFNQQTGKKLIVTSGYRSNEKQAELFNAKLKEYGGDRAKTRKRVAEPMPPLGNGRGSFHLKGLAVDINSLGPAGINVLAGDRESPTGWLEKFGLTRPVKKENWHIQPVGTLPTADNPVNPGAPTLVAGKDSKPMDISSGKKESIGQPETKSSSTSGGAVASASTDVAAGQRQQAKPQTPVIVNAPTTNTTVVQNNKTSPKKSNGDANKQLMAAAA
jgi:hypothetical protein